MKQTFFAFCFPHIAEMTSDDQQDINDLCLVIARYNQHVLEGNNNRYHISEWINGLMPWKFIFGYSKPDEITVEFRQVGQAAGTIKFFEVNS
jgi:hypothetical protein